MRVDLIGTGGQDGWPAPGCGCASCRRAAGRGRKPVSVLIDGVLRFGTGERPVSRAGYRVTGVPGGWDIAGPDGRLLCADGQGRVPDPPQDAGRFDVVLLDMLAGPEQLGLLRRRGVARDGTVVAVIYADHRISSEAELARRCGLWRVRLAGDGDSLTAPGPAGDGGRGWRALVLGGARSGKSAEAEMRLAAEPRVSYVATGSAPPEGGEPGAGEPGGGESSGGEADWAARVAAHRARRPPWWQTIETMDVAGVLARREPGAVLIDGVGGWLARAMDECGCWESGPDQRLGQRIGELVSAWRASRGQVVAVSDEAGLGVVPATRAGGMFRDVLGQLNQRLAAESDETALVVAGRVLDVPG